MAPTVAGDRFGRLVVLDPKVRARLALVRCDCGTEKLAGLRHLKNGAIKSCGCLRRETGRRMQHANLFKHGLTTHPLYDTWKCMHSRCYNPADKRYARYGGRGIRVCDEWHGLDGCRRFYEYMGQRPGPGYSIDRIDNDRGYEPGNVRWATRREQSLNTHRAARYRERRATADKEPS